MGYYKIKRYKYITATEEHCIVPEVLRPKRLIRSPNHPTDWFVELSPTGLLIVRKGYPFDGPSGPTWDRKTNMRGAKYHDALYELCRAGQVPLEKRKDIDELFRKHLLEDGMRPSIARAYYWGVRMGGYWSAKPQDDGKYKVWYPDITQPVPV